MSTTTENGPAFKELGLSERLTQLLISFPSPTPIQSLAIPSILSSDDDLILKSRTGSGKTLAYLIPILQLLDEQVYRKDLQRSDYGTQVLIILPTRELAIQTHTLLESLLRKLTKPHWITNALLCGGETGRSEEKTRLKRGSVIVCGTPGRIQEHLEKTQCFKDALKKCRWLVMDEADRLGDAGFKPKVEEINRFLPAGCRLIFVSATCQSNWLRPQARLIESAEQSDQLRHFYALLPTKLRIVALLKLLKDSSFEKSIVFASCQDVVDYLHEHLRTALKDVIVLKLYGKMDQSERKTTLTSFKKEPKTCLIATDLAARGLDWPDIDQIIQLDVPLDPEDYVHRAGRTDRQYGKKTTHCRSVLMLMPSEEPITEFFLKNYNLTLEKLRIDIEEVNVKPNELAEKAFRGFLRAYATHGKLLKPICHVKRLHLGQLAASFGLSKAPKIAQAVEKRKATTDEARKNISKDRSLPKRKKRLACSEFDAGGV